MVAWPTFPVAPVTRVRMGGDATVAPMRSPAIIVAVSLLIAGCGGSAKSGTTTGTDGKALFAGTCGGCHTLSDAKTSGTFGPNLDDLKPDKATVTKAIATGPGGMPEKLFKGAQAEAVATYVSTTAGK